MPLIHILVDFDNKQPTIEELSRVSGDSQRLWVFSSPHSGKFKADYVQALLAHQGRAQLVHCTRAGHNAVDMHIALHIGRLIADRAEVGSGGGGDEFVVVSGDNDFAPLLEYVRGLGYGARQVKSVKDALGGGGKAAKKAAATPKKAAVEPPVPGRAAASPPAKAASGRPAAAPKKAAKAPAAKAAGRKAPAAAPAAKKAAAPLLATLADDLRKHAESRPVSLKSLGKWLANRKVAAGEIDAVVEQLQATKVLRIDGKKVSYIGGANGASA